MLFSVESMANFLGLQYDEKTTKRLFGEDFPRVERSGTYGYIELKDSGISIMFKEAEGLVPESGQSTHNALYYAAIHFHAQGHEGYSEFRGRLPGGVIFGDHAETVRDKLGEPVNGGGGQKSVVLGRPVPKWLRYRLQDFLLNVQFGQNGELELLTIFMGDQIGASNQSQALET